MEGTLERILGIGKFQERREELSQLTIVKGWLTQILRRVVVLALFNRFSR